MLIDAPAPIDLARTLGAFRTGGSDPSLRLAGGTAWRACRTPDGPASAQIVATDVVDGRLASRFAVRTWGPGADWAQAHVEDLLGFRDDPDAFSPADRFVGELHRRNPGLRFGRSGCVVEGLIPTILGQKVTTIEAQRSWRALCRAHAEPAPGPPGAEGLVLRPDPARLGELRYSDFHRFGVERRRAETIMRVSRRAASLEQLVRGAGGIGGDAPALRAALESIPGIGPWSSAITAQQALGDPDSVVVGDYHLPNMVAWNLAGEPRATDARMLELLAPYAGHRARVVRLLGTTARHAPKRGPKKRIRSIAHI
jgi:3-methyladenine DNA glycosylase/8-oxoguanine DNA glycosylase